MLIIDEDLGTSGASVEGRTGFQRLLSEVALNHVGLILGVEMSRLARSCKDWYQLLELCALFQTLIADLDGLYDPTSYNDRLLLGLKGTMSEAELHILKQRMLQGALQKARRGELVSKVPIGYVRNTAGHVQLDPDEQAQAVVRMVFEQFARLGSASRVLRWFVRYQVKLPVRQDSGPCKGDLEWRRPSITTIRNLLTHPMYAGAYVYGRTCQNPTTRQIRNVPQRLPQQEWQVLLKDRYPAYITWQDYERNVTQLAMNRTRRRGVARQGTALLAGLVTCERCGFRMSTRYQGKSSLPRYLCERERANYGLQRCQSIRASVIDNEVTRLALLALTPAALDVSLEVSSDLEQRRAELEAHWKSRLERAAYDVDRARRQYDAVEPENRLVARTLEQAWEEELRNQRQLEQEYRRFQQDEPQPLTSNEDAQIRSLAADLPALWTAQSTTDEDRKHILRQLIECVTVNAEGRTEWIEIRVHWAGGQETYSRVRRPVAGTVQLSRSVELKARLKELSASGLKSHEIAQRLNEEGFRPAKSKVISAEIVRIWLSRLGLCQTRRQPPIALKENEWTIPAIIERYHLPNSTIYGWIRRKEINARQISGPGSRWILRATPTQLESLINNRRNRTSDAEDKNTNRHQQQAKTVSRGAV
ncbi:MAG: recombinase family protein [Pirellulales bacterium]